MENGFDVTQEEVKEYIEELKILVKEAANYEEIKKLISQFDSEEEYWEYEKRVYEKQLPIQKYVQMLENEYVANHGAEDSDSNSGEMWNNELDKIKKNAVKKQNYKKVGILNSIDEKFEAK